LNLNNKILAYQNYKSLIDSIEMETNKSKKMNSKMMINKTIKIKEIMTTKTKMINNSMMMTKNNNLHQKRKDEIKCIMKVKERC
jgi:hypothetical protein